jgi:hypothetical protein
MATLALFNRPADPNASHDVLAPGGFERWHFDAEDGDGRRRIVIDFFEGFPFYPAYLRRYHRYLRNPTRLAPPVPADYRSVSLSVFEDAQITARLFHLGRDYGANSFSVEAGGALRLQLRGAPWMATSSGPAQLDQQTLSAEFVFQPIESLRSVTESVDPLAEVSEYSQYQVSQGACEVSGQLHVYGQGAELAPIDIRLRGGGFFDHFFGLAPMSECIRRVMYGRVILANRVLVLEVIQEEEPPAMTQGELLQIDASGERSLDAGEMNIDWRATPLRVGAPPRVTFADYLDLSNPRVLDANAVSAIVLYDATAGGEKGTALCEVIYPVRLRSLGYGMWLQRWVDRANAARDRR